MWAVLAWLAGSKIGRIILGVGIIAFFIFSFRVWLTWHDASVAKQARAGYVLLSEKLAAEALANEFRRQLTLAQQLREQADREAEQLEIKAQERRDADEKAIAEDKDAGAVVGSDDLDWISRMRKRP